MTSSRFSGALQLTDLDDFIKPSQQCIIPTRIVKSKSTGSKVKIGSDDLNDPEAKAAILKVEKPKKVEISLVDCLACSGCITSAEAVLVTKQSQEKLLNVLETREYFDEEGHRVDVLKVLISISRPAAISFAHRYNITPTQAACRLNAYFKSLGVDIVIDMGVAEDIAMFEYKKEFIERFLRNDSMLNTNTIPMLTSSCPGFICYAEKAHGKLLIPHISRTRSPQQVMGSLIKDHYARVEKIQPNEVYHVTVMPCYDKKLEASREDFYSKSDLFADVDCVITPVEIESMMENIGKSLLEFCPESLDWPWTEQAGFAPEIQAHMGSGSGGYAESVYIYAAERLFGAKVEEVTFTNINTRNSDFREAILKKGEKELLRVAIVNGFRNIQNLIARIKRGDCNYHFIEIMACPSGCLNGGALLRPKPGERNKDMVAAHERLQSSLPHQPIGKNLITTKMYDEWLKNEEYNITRNLHTTYRNIPYLDKGIDLKW